MRLRTLDEDDDAAVSQRSLPAAVRLVKPTRVAVALDDRDLLRFSTAGSVDDGKSTLIGRLLYDTKSIFQDQLQAIESASRRRGEDGLNLALLTDGLRAEREQNITIDVAYRYFSTPRRTFIIADTPGHVQYTRNMVTGASTAELAIVLVDARKGVVTQSKRHGFIASLLRIPHVVLAVNKMDLVDYREDVFRDIVDAYEGFAEKLGIVDLACIPICALRGDNVVERSHGMDWYDGPTLLRHLETVNVGVDRNLFDFRLAVQCVIRPNQDYRGLAGRIASGTLAPGEHVVVLPSGLESRVTSVEAADGAIETAVAGDSVVVRLADDIDVGRGDMLVRPMNLPEIGRRLDATICWLNERPLEVGFSYILQHTTRTVRAVVTRLVHRIDVNSLHREHVSALELNDIGRVEVTTAEPIFFDPYDRNRATGGFILIDPFTNATMAAGMIRGAVRTAEEVFGRADTGSRERPGASPNVVWESAGVAPAEREVRNGHSAAVVWLTGLSGSGKSTLARAMERRLFEAGCQVSVLDGDRLRHGLCGDLAFSPADRAENIRRAGEVARILFERGDIVLCAFVSPYAADRARVRSLLPVGRFVEVFVDCPLEECTRRDVKGLYARAVAGELPGLTGVHAPYEPPDESCEMVLHTDRESVAESAERLMNTLVDLSILPRPKRG
ncbi:MAG TPA: adenylyl-sulfate kinase [Thermomicrobiaceae bacterium]|nr:adenylyl-sulfate kinase [Thermomicrobiaceae bacterium]